MKTPRDSCFDVIVVGSGPAGAIAAYQLASSGLLVALLEKETLPRYKTCGGGLVYRTLRWLPFSVAECVENECFRARMRIFRTPLEFEVERPVPIVSMTMRSTFDMFLVEKALAAGALLLQQTQCRKVVPKTEWVEVETSERAYRARFVVAADGVNSQVARSLDWPDQPVAIPALEWELEAPRTTLADFAGVPLFDFDAAKAGYGWVFPKRNHLSVGILSTRRAARQLRRELETYLKELGLAGLRPLRTSGHQIPVRPRKVCSRHRILLVGDAAGVAEPVTGEGISLAIRSGLLAASALVSHQLQSPESEEQYESDLKQEIRPELRWGRVVAGVAYSAPGLRNFLFRRQGQRLCEIMTDVLVGNTRYRDLAWQPSNYCKLLRNSG